VIRLIESSDRQQNCVEKSLIYPVRHGSEPDHYDDDPPGVHPDDGSGVSGLRVPVDHDAELPAVRISPDVRRLHWRD
jgi:hypothetical protein